jgi:hypothetical protein
MNLLPPGVVEVRCVVVVWWILGISCTYYWVVYSLRPTQLTTAYTAPHCLASGFFPPHIPGPLKCMADTCARVPADMRRERTRRRSVESTEDTLHGLPVTEAPHGEV